MKIVTILLTLLLSQFMTGQDYFAVVVKNENTTYNYPESVEFTLIDESGSQQILGKDAALTLEGNYTLSIKTPWKSAPEIIKSDGGKLEIFILPMERRNWTQNFENGSQTVWHNKHEKKPGLERKEIMLSKANPKSYNLLAVFNNGLVFKYEDGVVRAWLNSKEIEVTNHYLVQTPEGLLKASFDPVDGEFWYVFDI
ncbi:hypothetical protein [Maribacter sp. 4G9]|uniref:hypothetical protein n=1 Tax=Maribacter sp. 4G9 TaxID=1889777 RepID=UPI000C15D29F|nr:hypothetical protein [Maribacter sp. 4G9]PIB23585.1 hypothetical protein BFP75_09995 [Maribacter sp. 4G9]